MRRPARARARAGGRRPGQAVRDALVIGARVLDREQAGQRRVRQGRVRAGLPDVEHQFTDKARTIAEHFESQFAAVFGEEDGQLAKDLERLFGDGSAASVQNRVREAGRRGAHQVARGPRAPVLRGRRAQPARRLQGPAVRDPAGRPAPTPPSAPCSSSWASSRRSSRGCGDEKEKLEEVGAERERGTAKGRTFEEAVADAVDAIALRPGRRGRGRGRPARGLRQDRRRRGGHRRLQRARPRPDRVRGQGQAAVSRGARGARPGAGERRADFAVLVVPTEEELPAKLEPLREYNGDKLVVALDPDAGRWRSRWATGSRAPVC